jgi:hypothetical protein
VEGLLRLTNILEATNGTLKDVNNICTLAINSAKYWERFWIKELRVLHPDGINRKQ